MKYRFVDKIIECREGEYIVGTKSVSTEEYLLQRPLGFKNQFPATLMAEAMFQLGNFLIYKTYKTKLALLSMFRKIEIHNTLSMGDTMEMKVELKNKIDDNVMMNGTGFSNGVKVFTGHGCIGTLVDIEMLYNPEKYEILFKRLSS